MTESGLMLTGALVIGMVGMQFIIVVLQALGAEQARKASIKSADLRSMKSVLQAYVEGAADEGTRFWAGGLIATINNTLDLRGDYQ